MEVKQLTELYVVDSETEYNLWYFVCVDEEGDTRCDCPGFVYNGRCKHADAVINSD